MPNSLYPHQALKQTFPLNSCHIFSHTVHPSATVTETVFTVGPAISTPALALAVVALIVVASTVTDQAVFSEAASATTQVAPDAITSTVIAPS